jgi:hypothetical protein
MISGRGVEPRLRKARFMVSGAPKPQVLDLLDGFG